MTRDNLTSISHASNTFLVEALLAQGAKAMAQAQVVPGDVRDGKASPGYLSQSQRTGSIISENYEDEFEEASDTHIVLQTERCTF